MNKPELSIVIVHFQKFPILKLCLDSVYSQDSEFDFEVIVIDSQSTRESRRLIVESFPQVKLLYVSENSGYAKGVNMGIRASEGDFIMILNQDTVVEKEALSELLDFMKSHPDVGLVGPQLLFLNGNFQNSYFRFYKPITILARRLGPGKIFKKTIDDFLMNDTEPHKLQTPDWISGAAMMVNRKAMESVGLMDERFFFYFEDVDWCRRFWQNGYKVVYYPEAKVYHALGRGSKSRSGFFDLFFNQKTHWHIISALKYFWKYRKKVIRYQN